MLKQKLDTSLHSKTRLKPITSSLDISEQEYREFLSNVGFAMNDMKSWLNKEVFMFGLPFPYKMDEIDTQITFAKGIMHISSEIKENLVDFLDEEYMPGYHLPDV